MLFSGVLFGVITHKYNWRIRNKMAYKVLFVKFIIKFRKKSLYFILKYIEQEITNTYNKNIIQTFCLFYIIVYFYIIRMKVLLTYLLYK